MSPGDTEEDPGLVRALRIVPLATRAELVPVVARWHWDAWGHGDPSGSLEAWTDGLRGRLGTDGIPISWVALFDERPVGSVALIENDMATHPELSPWLSGLYVVDDARGRGIGSALTEHCESAAAALGCRALYLYTTRAEGLYRQRGWEPFARERYGSEDVVVMRLPLRRR